MVENIPVRAPEGSLDFNTWSKLIEDAETRFTNGGVSPVEIIEFLAAILLFLEFP